MLKALLSTFYMSECLYTFALYNKPINSTSSNARLSSPKYVPMYSSTESNLESSRWDMKCPDILLQEIPSGGWIPNGGFWIIHVVSQTKSISTFSSPLGLGPVKSWSRLVMPIISHKDTRNLLSLC